MSFFLCIIYFCLYKQGISEDDLPDELENYVAPLYIRKNFPYYHAGEFTIDYELETEIYK